MCALGQFCLAGLFIQCYIGFFSPDWKYSGFQEGSGMAVQFLLLGPIGTARYSEFAVCVSPGPGPQPLSEQEHH